LENESLEDILKFKPSRARKMKDEGKTKKQLIEEVSSLRRRVAHLKGPEVALEGEEHYRAMIEASPAAIMAIRDGCFLFVNPAGARMLGFSDPKEMVGAPVLDFIATESQQLVSERIQRLESGKDNPTAEIELVRHDGSRITVESTSVSISIEGIPTAVIIAQNISKRKELETELKESERRFRAFMDNNPASIYIKDENDRHIYGNPAALAEVGKKPDEFFGSTTRDLWPPEVAAKLIELDRKVLKENIPRITEEWSDSASGDVVWRRDIKFPIKLGTDKKLLGGIALDITEIKQSEQRLQNAYNEIKHLKEKLEQENIYLREEISLQHGHHKIIGQSDVLKSVLSQAERVAATDSTVLILGETGTGKELLAHSVHDLSSRKEKPMLTVNCSAFPGSLIESELFGREKGAYTGALTKRLGRFEVADGSTIFLDEISELPLELQAKLLRVLEGGSFERLGSSQSIKVDVRVIAATNRDLEKEVSQGRFREDLYYRLNVFPLTVPPLRDRLDDVPLLVWTFVKEYSERMGKRIESIPRKTMESLQRYSWPGNVRELKNMIERAVILSKSPSLHVEIPGSLESEVPDNMMTLEELEKRHIANVLETTGWRVRGKNGAAEILGLKPTTLDSRIKKLGIPRRPDQSIR
jgi:PAS domain S-box-containing protein